MGLLKKNDYFAELKQTTIDKEKQVLFYNFFFQLLFCLLLNDR